MRTIVLPKRCVLNLNSLIVNLFQKSDKFLLNRIENKNREVKIYSSIEGKN